MLADQGGAHAPRAASVQRRWEDQSSTSLPRRRHLGRRATRPASSPVALCCFVVLAAASSALLLSSCTSTSKIQPQVPAAGGQAVLDGWKPWSLAQGGGPHSQASFFSSS